MVRAHEGEKLDGWLEEAEASDATVLKKFAAGLDAGGPPGGVPARWPGPGPRLLLLTPWR
jgi:hypothetical protein